MGPGEIALDPNGKGFVKNIFNVGVVMTNGSDAAEKKIANSAPPETGRLGNCAMLCYRRGFGMMDIFGPLEKIAISARAESREQSKFQMIVSVYETGEQEEPAEIHAAPPISRMT